MELLPDMALFVAVARAKNFSVAARAIGMPVSSVSRRVAELEARIGLPLLNRTTRKVELTEVGAEYFERCRSIVEAAEAAHGDLKGQLDNPRGHLRVSATPDFASTFLTPLFVEFARVYPEITFECDLTPRAVDLVAESFDVAIRVGKLPDSQITVRRLGSARGGLFASPGYLARAGSLAAPRDLEGHECVRVLRSTDDETTWTLRRGEEQIALAVKGRFVANNIRFLLQLATLGIGIAALDLEMARPEVEAGRLVRVLPAWSPPAVPIHALSPSRLLPARTRLFLDCLSRNIQGIEATGG